MSLFTEVSTVITLVIIAASGVCIWDVLKLILEELRKHKP
jgi:hypothetical protein